MDCNREEAFRAKDIAEKKMQSKDFPGARKFVLKAQQLCPEIENISQMLSVCDVHCSAENKMFGNEIDWYGILQVEQTADDLLIKKQYRKFALLLHPDKNKFAGAEAAFKFIGEAQRVLLDKDRRSLYDIKRRTSHKPVIQHKPPPQASRNVGVVRQSNPQNIFSSNPNSHVRGSNLPHQETFWTLCLHCSVRFKYYREVLGKAIRCSSCKKPFVTYDMHGTGSATTQPVFPQQGSANAPASNFGMEAKNVKPNFDVGQKAGVNMSPKAKQQQKGPNKVDRQEQGSKLRKVNGQRGKKHEESSESSDSDCSLDSEEVEIHDAANPASSQHFDSDGGRQTRRSNRNKRHVTYEDNASDDEQIIPPSKKAKENASTEEKADASNIFEPASGEESKCNMDDGTETVAGSTNESFEADDELDSSLEPTPESPAYHEYPDPEFCDFDKAREANCFKVGQLWAAYATVDAMPRYYAKIKKIYASKFKLQITWLEADPDDEVGLEWTNSDLPFSCGKFTIGNTEITEDRPMFSHMVSGYKSIGRNCFMIYPRKGEIWAIFKNWDAKWCLISENERKFEYEFVEILSDYDEIVGIRVAPLGKLKGFASLFCRTNVNEVQIRPAELLRFSHMVPSYKMTGNERTDVPEGSFELDPAAITINLEETTLPPSDGKNCLNDLSSKFAGENPTVNVAGGSAASYREHEKGSKVEHKNGLNGNVGSNFDAMKSMDKIQVNQVWALYSVLDGLPKCYGCVKKIDPGPDFKLHVMFLEPCLTNDVILWKEKNMPVSCGQFSIKPNKTQTYTNTSSFSHLIHAEQTGRKNVYAIYPRKGEVWALHKIWNPGMKPVDLQTCDYDVVEILEANDSQTKVAVLERVDGYNAIFKPQKSIRGSLISKEIPRAQLLRFSHQIPCFRLPNEKGNGRKDYLELDPAAFPAKDCTN